MSQADTQPLEPDQRDDLVLAEAEFDDATHNRETTAHSMSERWICTLFVHAVGEDWQPQRLKESCEYVCWGLERCPSTGREHWHVYLRFARRTRFNAVINLLRTNRVKIFMAKGTEQQCLEYCHKTGKHAALRPLTLSTGELGEIKPDAGRQGKRSDLQDLGERIIAGAPMLEIARADPVNFIRYNRGLQALADITRPPPPIMRPVTVFYLWGPTATGKSWRVISRAPTPYTVESGPHPWDGYNGETTLLFEEWRSSKWEITTMNRILDCYIMQLPCRYKNKYAEWTTVFITSNDSPAQTYPDEPNPLVRGAFLRRLGHGCREVTLREDQGGPSLDEIIASPPNPDFP